MMDDLLAALRAVYPPLHGSPFTTTEVLREARGTTHLKLLSEDGTKYSVKERPRYMLPADWIIPLQVHDYLWRVGASVPGLILTKNGDLQFEWLARAFRLASWADGKHPTHGIPDVGRLLGTSLAELHLYLQGFKSTALDIDNRPYSRHRTYPTRLPDWFSLLRRLAPPTPLGEQWCEDVTYQRIQERMTELLNSIDFCLLTRSFVHGDAHMFNAITTDSGITWIDLDDSRLDFRLVDLIWLVLVSGFFDWTGIDHPMRLRREPRWPFVLSVIDAFSRNVRLDDIERRILPELLELYFMAAIDNCLEREELHISYSSFSRGLKLIYHVNSHIRCNANMLRDACQ